MSPDLDDALDHAAQISLSLNMLTDQTQTHGGEYLHDLHELGSFSKEATQSYNWVIPGLLEHMDRVIVVASEGAGKSTWMRSVAAMVGQGVHPLNPMLRIPPKRTLIVDLENPTSLIRRASRRLVSVAEASGGWADDQVYLWSRPGGINIRKAADAALLDRLVGHVRPDLLCLGPLYKASLGGSDRGEQVAAEVTAALDKIRERHGCAMWLEHHAPMAQNGARTLRPIDSGLWSRWPEFGITLERDGEQHHNQFRLGRFRADRAPRCWPDTMAWGPHWPFEFAWDAGMPGGLHDGVWAEAS
jgi:replicative DNA helicase